MSPLFDRFRKPKSQLKPTKEEALFATRASENLRRHLQGYVVEPSVAQAMDRTFLAEGCREYGMALLSQRKPSQAIEEFKRAYLLVPHPADFCCMAMAYSDMEAWDEASKALHVALTDFVSEERALGTARRLFDWLGLQEAESAAKMLVPWMNAQAALRVCPDLYAERAKTEPDLDPRRVLLDWLRGALESIVQPDQEEHGPCPHCGHSVWPTVESRQCGKCGAVVGLYGPGSIKDGAAAVRALYAPERPTVNPALREVVSKSKRGSDFSARFERLTERLRKAGIAYAANVAGLVPEDERPSAERGLEGMIQLALRFALAPVLNAMAGYFEDSELQSWALDAVAIDLIGKPASYDMITQSYWKAEEIGRKQELERHSELTQFGRDVAQAIGVDIRNDILWPMAATAPAPLLAFDASEAVRLALLDDPPDASRRQELVRSATAQLDKLAGLRGEFDRVFPQADDESSE
jgi:hypothetical protein